MDTNTCFFDFLPNETVLLIFDNDVPKLLNCLLVNKRFNKLIQDPSLWNFSSFKKYEEDPFLNHKINFILQKFADSIGMEYVRPIRNFGVVLDDLNYNNPNWKNRLLENDINYTSRIEAKRLKGITVPKEIKYLTNLRVMECSEKLEKIDLKNLKYFVNLQELNLSMNNLTVIPEEVWQLTGLQELSLSGNKLEEIPKDIVKLTNLKRIFLSFNQIKEIPKELAQLTKLECINLGFNQIKTIPKELAQLVNLNSLDLDYNQVRDIPIELKQIQGLKITMEVSYRIRYGLMAVAFSLIGIFVVGGIYPAIKS